MRIVHVYKDYPPIVGGIENHVRLLAEGQANRGLDVTVLVTGAGPRSDRQENGVRVIRAQRFATLASTPLSTDLVRTFSRLDADVRHLHLPYPLADVAQLRDGRPGAVVVTYHSDVVRQRVLRHFHHPLLRRLLARADRIVVASPQLLESARALARVRHKCVVVPYGIDARFLDAPDREGVRAVRRDFPGPRVLFVGRLRYYKGVDVLIHALAQVDATLLIAGSGEMERRWRGLAASSPAAPRIRFLGHLDDQALAHHYAAADVFVLPSHRRSEAFGLVLLEAMACGTPVISTELGTGTSYANRHGETGLVVEPGDGPALADALRRLLDDAELRRRLGDAARRRVRDRFLADRMVVETIGVYRRARSNDHSAARPASTVAEPTA